MRPKIKDYFGENATLQQVVDTYKSQPKLFNYAQSLDRYIDDIETKWISIESKMPDVDYGDEWNINNRIAKRCLTFSEDWGIRFGQYFGLADKWNIDGVTNSKGIKVTHWMPIPVQP